MDNLSELPRRDITWRACDALAKEGKKPSIGLVRSWTSEQGTRRGSDGDVQKDIDAWFSDLYQMRLAGTVEGLPDSVTALTRQLWRKAVDLAANNLDGERASFYAERSELFATTAAAVEEAKAANARHEAALAVIAEKDNAVRRLDEQLAEIRATMQSKDVRIEGLEKDLNRLSTDHVAKLVELDGARKQAMMQIDEARAQGRSWKAEYERVDAENKATVVTYRQRASSLETQLAELRTRFELTQETLEATKSRENELRFMRENDLKVFSEAKATKPQVTISREVRPSKQKIVRKSLSRNVR